MHYYKFNVSSWAKDTGHLSLKEEAIYLRLINYYYDNEKQIPLKTQLVLRKLRMADESETVDLILEEFFVKSKGGWHHPHCDKLINEYQSRAERNRENGKSGGRPKINELGKPSGLVVDTEIEPSGNLNYKLITTNDKLETKEPETKEKKPKKTPAKLSLDDARIVEAWNSLGCVRHISVTKKAVAAINKTYKEYRKLTESPAEPTDWVVNYIKSGFSRWMTDHHRQMNDGQWAADLEFAVRHDTYEKVKSTVVTTRTASGSKQAYNEPELTKEEREAINRRELQELMEDFK